MAAERIRQFFDEQGLAYEIHDHPREVAAQRLAPEEHVSGWLVAKPVMLQAGGRLVMAVVPAPLLVDLEKAQARLGVESVRLAREDEFSDAFPDCEVGAEPPFGNLYGVSVYVDRRLLEAPKLVCRAGSHTATVVVDTTDYLRLVQPTEVDIARA